LTQTQHFLQRKFNQTEYAVAGHIHDTDGMYEDFTKNPFNKEVSCAMSPSCMKNILEMNGHTELHIVIMSDVHDEAKVHKLQKELEDVVVPQWDFGAKPSTIADIVLGAANKVFINIQGSSGLRNTGILREGFGQDVASNYVSMDKTEEGNWTSFYPCHVYTTWAEETADPQSLVCVFNSHKQDPSSEAK
jgi:hypothetical protein